MGLGKLPDDGLLFVGLDGALPSQKRYSKAWSDFRPDMGFHNLRHTHASQLIDRRRRGYRDDFQAAWPRQA
jgi:integrase